MLIFLCTLPEEDSEFISELFAKYNKMLYQKAYQILQRPSDAEDAVCQVFYKLTKDIYKVISLPEEKQLPYCLVMVKHEAISMLRKNNRCIPVGTILQEEMVAGTEQLVIEQLESEEFWKNVNRLSIEERQFIHLRFWEELSLAELAKLLNITEEAAKKRSQRILKRLRMYCEEGEMNVV